LKKFKAETVSMLIPVKLCSLPWQCIHFYLSENRYYKSNEVVFKDVWSDVGIRVVLANDKIYTVRVTILDVCLPSQHRL